MTWGEHGGLRTDTDHHTGQQSDDFQRAMNFKQFEAFYWLTRLKSYQRVAEQINLTQPAVSVRVLGLEESLGVKLIESHAPNFKLTEKGHQAAEFAEAFINLQERMLMSLKADAATPLHIGMVEPAMMTWGARFLEAVNTSDQPIQTRLSTGSNYDLQRLTAEGVLDIVFATASMGGPALADTFSRAISHGMGRAPPSGAGDGSAARPKRSGSVEPRVLRTVEPASVAEHRQRRQGARGNDDGEHEHVICRHMRVGPPRFRHRPAGPGAAGPRP